MEQKTLTGTQGSGDGGTTDQTRWFNCIISGSALGGQPNIKEGSFTEWEGSGKMNYTMLTSPHLSRVAEVKKQFHTCCGFFEVSTPIFVSLNLFALSTVSKVLQSISGAADMWHQLLSQWHPHRITCLSRAKLTFHSQSSVFPLDQCFVLFLFSLLFKHQLCSRSSLLIDLKYRPYISIVSFQTTLIQFTMRSTSSNNTDVVCLFCRVASVLMLQWYSAS